MLCDTPRNIWERTKGYAGISESDFFSYFEGRDKACAYVVGNVNVFLKPKTLQDYGIDAGLRFFVISDKLKLKKVIE